MFQSITGKEKDYENTKISFDQFLSFATSSDLMDGLLDQHNI